MRHEEQKRAEAPAIEPAESGTPVPRSGAGAGSALFAMLKKRQMGVTRDAEPDPQAPGTSAREASNRQRRARLRYAAPMNKSAGLLMYRRNLEGALQVLLAHPGGPFWQARDEGAWTIPKGEYDESEPALAAAQREFTEETGFDVTPPFIELGEIVQKSGKRIAAWAFAGECEPSSLRCNTFEMEWPARSGRRQAYPEIDRAAWLELPQARRKINPAQRALLDRLETALAARGDRR
jgi:predicted NUDIX family NTP pyrophosphohydrolase